MYSTRDASSCVEETCRQLKRTTQTAAEETLKRKGRTKGNKLFDRECKKLVEKRNKERTEYLERPTRPKNHIYEESRRSAKRLAQQKKGQYLNKTIIQVEEEFQKNITREA